MMLSSVLGKLYTVGFLNVHWRRSPKNGWTISLMVQPYEKSLSSVRTLVQNKIASAELELETKLVKLYWTDFKYEKYSCYPLTWLRDNCQCTECFSKETFSRLLRIDQLKIGQIPSQIQVLENEKLEVGWCDGHVSVFSWNWLQSRSFNRFNQRIRKTFIKPQKQKWGQEFWKILPNFEDILKDDDKLYDWLCDLDVYGISLLSGVPVKPNQVHVLADRVKYSKRTHYGHIFDVIARPDASNVAYTDGPLQLHTDLPYYLYVPGVTLLHCIVQDIGSSGHSLVSDGLQAAQQLRDRYLSHYEVLVNTDVDWIDIGLENNIPFYKICCSPVLSVNDEDQVECVRFSQPQRDSFFTTKLENVESWYEAFKVFSDLLHDPANLISFQMKPGEMLAFDNTRVVHGRGQLTSGNKRHMQGTYIDWDEVRCRRRTLAKKCGRFAEY